MISVQSIYKRVQDLSRKDKGGYMSKDEFNRDLNETQHVLMDYYYDRFAKQQYHVDSLAPFTKENHLLITNGFCDYPDDYRHRVEIAYAIIENVYNNDCTVSNPTQEEVSCRYLHPDEERLTITSAIRKPSLVKGRLYHTFVNNKIKVLPLTAKGYLVMKYISQPILARYETVVNPATDSEDYDISNSIDLAWNPQDEHNIVDIMLLFKGIQTRESALINWVIQKKQIVDVK